MGSASLQESYGRALGQAEPPTLNSTHSYWHRDPSKRLLGHRTTSDLQPTADVVIVGSGITGTFAAQELVSGGRGVVMLEAREACWGATGRVRLTMLNMPSHSVVRTSLSSSFYFILIFRLKHLGLQAAILTNC